MIKNWWDVSLHSRIDEKADENVFFIIGGTLGVSGAYQRREKLRHEWEILFFLLVYVKIGFLAPELSGGWS